MYKVSCNDGLGISNSKLKLEKRNEKNASAHIFSLPYPNQPLTKLSLPSPGIVCITSEEVHVDLISSMKQANNHAELQISMTQTLCYAMLFSKKILDMQSWQHKVELYLTLEASFKGEVLHKLSVYSPRWPDFTLGHKHNQIWLLLVVLV